MEKGREKEEPEKKRTVAYDSSPKSKKRGRDAVAFSSQTSQRRGGGGKVLKIREERERKNEKDNLLPCIVRERIYSKGAHPFRELTLNSKGKQGKGKSAKKEKVFERVQETNQKETSLGGGWAR